MQKSCIDWIRLGDGNKRFFHTSMLVQRRRNKIDELRDDAGQWISDGETLKDMAVIYYKELYIQLEHGCKRRLHQRLLPNH